MFVIWIPTALRTDKGMGLCEVWFLRPYNAVQGKYSKYETLEERGIAVTIDLSQWDIDSSDL